MVWSGSHLRRHGETSSFPRRLEFVYAVAAAGIVVVSFFIEYIRAGHNDGSCRSYCIKKSA